MTRAINNLSISTQSQMVSPFIVEALVPQELRSGANAASRLKSMILKLEEHVAKLTINEDEDRQIARTEKIRLRERVDVLNQTRDKLDDEWVELIREKPAGIISRTFLGGRSAAEIERVKREVVSRIGEIDRELVDITAKADEFDKKPKMTETQKQKLLKDQESALGDYRLLSKYINKLLPA